MLRRSCPWGLMLCGHCLDIFNHVKNYYRIIEDNFKNNFTLLNNVIFEIMFLSEV